MDAPLVGTVALPAAMCMIQKGGEPKNGIKPDTAFEDLPDSYVCPVCGVYAKIGKSAFVPTE